jgi:HEPN domain-containing protein
MNNLVCEWIEKSDEDWKVVTVLISEDNPLVTPALFHLQQSVEKLLKALLISRSIRFERRHDLLYLFELIDERSLENDAMLLAELNPFAVEYRYPGNVPSLSIDEAKTLIDRVAQFRDRLRGLIGDGFSEMGRGEPLDPG